MDFTLVKYKSLVSALKDAGYTFPTFEEFIKKPESKVVILRHDVDLRAINSLRIAQSENELGVKASYYFRVVPQSNQPEIINQIVSLGHEIGYHYEDISLFKGDVEESYVHFQKQLAYFRTYYPVKTICMNGSPLSKYDNRAIWEKYNYKDLGLIGEPYFDVDFNKVYYLTDTGRCWDGERFSVRDKVTSSFDLSFHSTDDIIKAAKEGSLPNQIMITTHPQRWTDNEIDWCKEFVSQNLKNIIKRILITLR